MLQQPVCRTPPTQTQGTQWLDKADHAKPIDAYGQENRVDPKDAEVYRGPDSAYANRGDLNKAIVDYSERTRFNRKTQTHIDYAT